MRDRVFQLFRVVSIGVSAIGGSTALNQSTAPITGARLSVQEKVTAEWHVTVQNNRDSSLIQWQVDALGRGGITSRQSIPPHDRRTLSFPLQEDRPTSRPATLNLAVFEDGYSEGHGPSLDEWIAERNERIEDLRYWVSAFMQMPRVSVAEMRGYLTDRVAERESRQSHQNERVSHKVSDLMRRYPEGPYIIRPLDQLRKDIEADLIVATRAPTGEGRPRVVDQVSAATVVSSETTPSKSYRVSIENLRDVPIEAYKIDTLDAVTGKARGSLAGDFCLADPAVHQPGFGRIQPHETRELSQPFEESSVRLSYIMSDDLSFEGEPADRERLLRDREDQAAEYPLALAALSEAVTTKRGEIEAFLLDTLTRWVKQTQQSGKQRPLLAGPLESMLRDVRRSPDQFVLHADAMRAQFEQQYRRLTRHLRAPAR